MDDEQYLMSAVTLKSEEEKAFFVNLITTSGMDKWIEFINNFKKLTGEVEPLDGENLCYYVGYEYALANFLYTLLRIQEDHLKGFLCNTFNGYQVQIEERPSNYSKSKYYFKIPYGVNNFLDIRTFTYKQGPVDYYDALKTMDFGDINMIFAHQPQAIIKKFSNNPDIIDDLDNTRKVRNYVYHHNILFSAGKDILKHSIMMIIRNLPHSAAKRNALDELANINKEYLGDKKALEKLIAIHITKKDEKLIFAIKPILE